MNTIIVTIFTHNRPDMLRELVRQIRQARPTARTLIVDDASENQQPDLANTYIRYEEAGGKPLFWTRWNAALSSLAKMPSADTYLFTQDDIRDIDFDRIDAIATEYAHKPHLFNTINDGREVCWNPIRRHLITPDLYRSYFTDCHFFCNSAVLSAIGWKLHPIPASRFNANPSISSGVGQQLTQRLNEARNVTIYQPVKSLCYHGDHPSVMHPSERVKTPLISL